VFIFIGKRLHEKGISKGVMAIFVPLRSVILGDCFVKARTQAATANADKIILWLFGLGWW